MGKLNNNVKKFFLVLLLSITLAGTGCTTAQRTTFVDGVLGRYPRFNALELDKAVDVQISIKTLEKRREFIDTVIGKIENLRLYGLNRPYNSRVTKQVDGLLKVATELQTRLKSGNVSDFYFNEKVKIMHEIADNIRLTISNEKL